jgi:hypothetical protein
MGDECLVKERVEDAAVVDRELREAPYPRPAQRVPQP